MYLDGSGRDGDITAAAINLYQESGQRLGDVGIALTYYGELEGLITATERLARISITDTECRGRIYKVYLDSQASLIVVDAIRSISDYIRLRRVQSIYKAIRARGGKLELYQIPGHAGVEGNEAADKVAERAYELLLLPPEQQKYEVAARTVLIRERARI